MGIIDWLVIATCGCLTMAVGAYYSRQHQSADDFLLGGRTMSPIALGLSLDKPNRSDQPENAVLVCRAAGSRPQLVGADHRSDSDELRDLLFVVANGLNIRARSLCGSCDSSGLK